MSRGWSSRARLLRRERAVRRGFLQPRLPEARAPRAALAASALLPAPWLAPTAANNDFLETCQSEKKRVPDAWEELDSASCCSAPGAGPPPRAAPAPAAEHVTSDAPGAVGTAASCLAAAALRGEALWETTCEKFLNTLDAQGALLLALVKRVEAGPVPAEPPPAGGELLAVVEAITKQITAVNARLDACVTVEHVEPLIAKLTEKAGELVREASTAVGARVAKLEKALADRLDPDQFETDRYDPHQGETTQSESIRLATDQHETNQHETSQHETNQHEANQLVTNQHEKNQHEKNQHETYEYDLSFVAPGVGGVPSAAIGRFVGVHGLKQAAHFNGRFGFVEGFDELGDRYAVRFHPDLPPVKVRRTNCEYPARCFKCRSIVKADACFSCGYGVDLEPLPGCGVSTTTSSDPSPRRRP